jgi:ribose transport system substrate-binding protein
MRPWLENLASAATVAIAAVAIGFGFTACGDNAASTQPATNSSGGASSGDVRKIAVIPKGTTDEFWKSIHAGAVKAQQELAASGTKIEPVWQGPIIANDSAKQISVVENMINAGVSAIVLAPADENALANVVETADKKGIPVIIIDSDLKTDKYKSFVATDNYKGGQLAGDSLAGLLNKKGKVIMLRHDKGQASTEKREQGFLDAIKAYPDIQVLSSNQYGGPTSDTAYKAAENLLAGFKNDDGTLKADGFFASNEGATYGLLKALQDVKATGKVKFIGFDASQALVSALKDGDINGLIVQDPVNMGYLGVKTAVDVLNGKTVERHVDTGVHLATKENMDTPDIHDLLYPPLDKYLK